MTTLLELANRVQKAEGPDRSLDEMIFEAVHGRKRNISTFEQYEPSERLPAYTSSFDAALLLVPEEHDWIVGSVNGQVGGTPYACVGSEQNHYGATPVLSLVLAALRVRSGAGT